MKPVFQQSDDDCFNACIASLLEVPYSEVPVFYGGWEQQMTKAQRWLSRRGYSLVEIVLPIKGKRDTQLWPHMPQAVPLYAIVTIYQAPYDKEMQYHCVIGRVYKRRIKIIHDPAPDYGFRRQRLRRKDKINAIAFLIPNQGLAT